MADMSYDVELLTPGGVKVEHHDTTLTTDGPWLIVRGATPDLFALIAPAHAVVSVRPCEGRCGNGGG